MALQKIVVVGAGAVGLFAAVELARRGADVTVIESELRSEEINATTSRAAAGMIGPLGEAAHQPENAHPRAGELALASYDLWRTLPAALTKHARFEGALALGESASAIAVSAQSHGRRVTPLTPSEVKQRFNLDVRDEPALFIADEGIVDPAPTLRALEAELTRLGGRIVHNVEIETVEQLPYRRVRGLGGENFTADQVLLATGVWARDSLYKVAPALTHLRAAKGVLAPARLAKPLAINVRGADFYLAPRGEGVVLGSTMEFDSFDRRADPARVAELFANAERTLPGQVSANGNAWAGVRPMSPDWSPLIGRSGEPDIYVACGHARNGWLLAPVTAAIVAAQMFGDDLPDLWRAFAPDRFDIAV